MTAHRRRPERAQRLRREEFNSLRPPLRSLRSAAVNSSSSFALNDPLLKLRNPPLGSRIETARDFGIDMTLLIERLHKAEERVRNPQHAIEELEKIRGKACPQQGLFALSPAKFILTMKI
jgi:hypothetical protein